MQLHTITLLALTLVALIAPSSTAQTDQPSSADDTPSAVVPPTPPPAAAARVDSKPIRRSPDSTGAARPAGAGVGKLAGSGTFDTTRVVLSLGIVLTLIFALRWLSQRLFGRTVARRSSRAVQVLSRNVISSKQQLLVVQVGRRLVVIGDSGQQMNPLCEITDPDEMSALIGQLHEEKRELSGNPFGTLFGRAGSAFEKENEPQRSVNVADEEDDVAVGLTAGMADGAMGPSHLPGAGDELSGLMDKVRGMSRQFRRT